MSHIENPRAAEVSAAFVGTKGPDRLFHINLRLRLDQIAELEAEQLALESRRKPTRRELCELAGKIYDARRARDRIFDTGYFGEPAWDMLLALYCLPSRGEIMTASSLAYASGGPPTTAYRWQSKLEEQGIIERGPSAVDLRKQMLRLTAQGRELLEDYLTRLFYCDQPQLPAPSEEEVESL